MDVMELRRGLLMQMASGGKELLHGEFTPTEDETSHTIDTGREIDFIIVQCTSNELISGTRNLAYIIAQFVNGEIRQYGSASNASGSSWGSVGFWYKNNNSQAVTKNGTAYTFAPNTFAGGARFYASRTYEWYAI